MTFKLHVCVCALCFIDLACEERAPTDKDVAIAQARARQAEAEAEKARLQAHGATHDSARPVLRKFQESKVDIAALTVKKFAYEAFAEWAATHPSQRCPNGLNDLAEYMDTKDATDPWGNPYKMLCGPAVPAGVKGGMAVQSAGEDGQFDTADDVKSWD